MNNQLLNPKVIENTAYCTGASMTVRGAVQKTGVLLAALTASAAWTWASFQVNPARAYPVIAGAMLVGLIAALVTCFKKNWSAVSAPVYALAEGVLIGGVSVAVNARFPGIALQASLLTFGTLFGLLGAYRLGWIRATEQFKAVVLAGTFAVSIVYLVSMVLRIFGTDIPFIHEGGTVGILFSAAVVVIAAMNLVMDFDFMERGAAARAPKYMEWYAAFGLMVSLIWLYMEILRLLLKLARRQ